MAEDQSVVVNKEEELVDLPPGFRFHPTDEEIITYYLTPKVVNSGFTASAVAEVDLNKCEPWDLPKMAKMGEKEWYFFCQRDRKYPTGTRTNRATESGYWKATGKDKEIFKGKGRLVGMKKTLVFYRGRAPKGEKSNWVMHEFRLEGKFSYYNLPKLAKDEWVVCRVFHKSSGIKKAPLMIPGAGESSGPSRINSYVDDLLNCSSSPPPLVDTAGPSSSFCADDHRSGFGDDAEAGDDDDTKFNYYPSSNDHSFDHPLIYNNNHSNNSYQMIMNQISSYQNPIFHSSSFQGGLMVPIQNLAGPSSQVGQLDQRCKVEQFSSNHDSTAISQSQDTGLSADMNNNVAEISSSKQAAGVNNNIIGMGSNIPDMADIDGLWDF